MTVESVNFMRLHTRALYVYDGNGRITGCNQFNGGAIPRFHLARTETSNYSVFRSDVPLEVVDAVNQLVLKEPPLKQLDALPKFQNEYTEILSSHRSVESIWHGPAYRFTNKESTSDPNVVVIDSMNMELLENHLGDWLDDVRHRRPFVALLDGGSAVAVCASARMTAEAHEAGVETVPAYRGRGYAARVVSAWAKAVSLDNAEPMYSTSWDNLASQAVANTLKLELVGTDFHIR